VLRERGAGEEEVGVEVEEEERIVGGFSALRVCTAYEMS
jgi:hypothetical protein